MGMSRRQEEKMLGVRFATSVREATRLSWMAVTRGTKCLARETQIQTLCLRPSSFPDSGV